MIKFRKIAFGMMLTVLSASGLADCLPSSLEGNWRVFYRDDGFPTSVLKPGKSISIEADTKTGTLSVQLTDPDWQGWSESWETVCVDDKAVLLGAIRQRRGSVTLVIEISRVDAEDLLPMASGEIKTRQIGIRFPQPLALIKHSDQLKKLVEQGALASHPGHAHGWD